LKLKDQNHCCFKSAHVEWGTPPDLRASLDAEFHFTLDPCQPDSVWDGREISWQGQRVFCNPPYGRGIDKWLAKGPEADIAVFLLPARTDTKWFHNYALEAAEIRFFEGRLSFMEKRIRMREAFTGNARSVSVNARDLCKVAQLPKIENGEGGGKSAWFVFDRKLRTYFCQCRSQWDARQTASAKNGKRQ
jgi:hypothetical protein